VSEDTTSLATEEYALDTYPIDFYSQDTAVEGVNNSEGLSEGPPSEYNPVIDREDSSRELIFPLIVLYRATN
jgi:hypothetical protein